MKASAAIALLLASASTHALAQDWSGTLSQWGILLLVLLLGLAGMFAASRRTRIAASKQEASRLPAGRGRAGLASMACFRICASAPRAHA